MRKMNKSLELKLSFGRFLGFSYDSSSKNKNIYFDMKINYLDPVQHPVGMSEEQIEQLTDFLIEFRRNKNG